MKKVFLSVFLVLVSLLSTAQNKDYARSIIDTLSSPQFFGRGYVNNGEKIAANYIASQYEKMKLKKFGDSYYQHFNIAINTFPDTLDIYIDGRRLLPGIDFVIMSSSPGIAGIFDLIWMPLDTAGNLKFSDNTKNKISEKVVITDMDYKKFALPDSIQPVGVIFITGEKMWWHVSDGGELKDYFQLRISDKKISDSSGKINIYAKNRYYQNYPTQNVIGYIEGKLYPDSFFVFTAHYDHLGQMGSEVYFPGANDNASGTAMMMDLARHYAIPENQPDYSIAFMAFSAEEAGLLGSSYFSEHPFFPLDQIKFLINFDMVGSGSQGIKVVNGSIFKTEFEKLTVLNKEYNYLISVEERGEAANSDHYPFYAKGVPCFFMYTLGDECKEYHNIYDVPEHVPLTEYDDFFRLITNYLDAF